MYIPDPIGEARCEDWWFSKVRGGEFECSCGTMCDLGRAVDLWVRRQVDGSVYAIPACPLCASQYLRDHYPNAKEDLP